MSIFSNGCRSRIKGLTAVSSGYASTLGREYLAVGGGLSLLMLTKPVVNSGRDFSLSENRLIQHSGRRHSLPVIHQM